MSIDFPRAWQIAKSMPMNLHHPECSYVITNGGLLCDCHIIYRNPEFLSDLFIGIDGKIIESWARRKLRHMWE